MNAAPVIGTPPPARPSAPPPPLVESEEAEEAEEAEETAEEAEQEAQSGDTPSGPPSAAPTPPPPPPQDYDQLTATIPFEDMYCADERDSEPLQDMVSIPSDLLSIVEFSKNHRTLYEFQPLDSQAAMEEYVKLCYHFFSAKWKLLCFKPNKYEKYSRTQTVYDLEAQTVVSSDASGAVVQTAKLLLARNKPQQAGRTRSSSGSSSPDSMVASTEVGLRKDDPFFEYSRPYDSDTDVINRKRRQAGRLPVFDYYDPLYKWAPGTEIALCNRIRAMNNPDAKRKKKINFRVTPTGFDLNIGVFEPFYFSLSLYEVSDAGANVKKLKLSESFCYDLNDDGIELMTNIHTETNHRARCSGALFGVTKQSTNIYLVLEMEKVFHGDYELAVEPYIKYTASVKDKEKEKIRAKLRADAPAYCSSFGQFRQPFGWACTPVFGFKGDLLIEGEFTFKNVYQPAREPIPDLIQALYANHPKTKLHEPPQVTKELAKRIGREVGATATIKSYVVEEDTLDDVIVLDSSLQPIMDCDGEEPDFGDYTEFPIREVFEFAQGPIRQPHMAFMNNLYLYPLTVNLSKLSSARNIAVKVEVRDSDDPAVPSLQCIYARNNKSGWTSEVYTAVRPKEKTPIFTEELKILLPPSLTASHHLLLTYLNMGKMKKGDKKPVQLLGYSTLPLYVNGRINLHPESTDEDAKLHKKASQAINKKDEQDYCISLPVVQATEIEAGYMNPATPAHMIDGGKPLLQMKYKLMSTIYPEDPVITRLFHSYGKTEEELASKQVVEILQESRSMSPLLAIQYMPVIIKTLLEIMTNRERAGGLNPPLEAFKCLVIVLHKIKVEMAEKVARTSLLELYINYIFDQASGSKKPIFEPLCFNFLLFMMEKKMQSESEDDSIFVNSWFLFDLIIKSMALYLENRGALNANNRTSLFPDSYRRSLVKLLSFLTTYFRTHLGTAKQEDMKILNRNLAVFIKDLLCVFDRGIVLDMIRTYLTEITHEEQYEISSRFKFEFLTIINDHDYYIPLNLPFGYDSNDMSLAKLSQKHPLAMILTYEVIETLGSGNVKAANHAIGSLYDVMIKQFCSAQFQNDEYRDRIAHIYFALLPLLLKQWGSDSRGLAAWREEAKIMEKREFYILVLAVIKHIHPSRFRTWLQQESLKNLEVFCEVLCEIIYCYEYSIDHKRQTKTLMNSELALFMTEVGSDEMKDLLKGSQDKVRNPGEELERLKHLSMEASLVILESLEEILSVHYDSLQSMGENPLLKKVISVFVAFMKKDQTEQFLHHLYASLRSFAYRFQRVLFRGDNNFVGSLVRQILRHCSFHNMAVNTEAATMLFVLLKLNHLQVETFNRTRIQAITSVSKLVSDRILKEDSMLKLSFARLSDFALYSYATFYQKDLGYSDHSRKGISYMHAQFTRGVQGLGETLGTILRDTIRVKQMEESADPEMIGDLYFQIAQGYMNTPDLRIEWLMHLAEFQAGHEHYPEAGMCLVHVAALIADYLVSLVGVKTINPDLFNRICPGVSEFAGDEEGLCQTHHFSIKGFLAALEKAIEYFRSGTLYEFAAVLYNTMIPVYEANNDYGKLAETYAHQSELWKRVEAENDNRLLGTYFRVGFYGQKYGEELDGSEWIYKEAGLTHLFDLKDRFVEFWSKRIGCEVSVIDASKDVTKLDPSACFIQITKVEPYVDPEEEAERKTFVKQKTSLRKFVIVTPFSSKGKAQTDDLADQYTKKTILVVKGSFPFMLTRLPVVHRDILVINPIDNSINALRERCLQFEEQLHLRQYQTLSQILQGTVLVMVSQGPLEICHVFLGNWQMHPQDKITELIDVIKVFVERCGKLLELNRELTLEQSPAPWTFHFECLAGYRYVKASMLEFVDAVNFARGAMQADDSDPYSESFTETTEADGAQSDDEDAGFNSLAVPSGPGGVGRKKRTGSVKAAGGQSPRPAKKASPGGPLESPRRKRTKTRGTEKGGKAKRKVSESRKLPTPPPPPVDSLPPPEGPPEEDEDEY